MIALAFLGHHWKPIGATLAALVILWSIFSHFADDRATRAALETLRSEAGTVVIKLQEASGNPKVEWSTAAGQITALGESNRSLSQSIAIQNERLDDMARQAVRARAKAVELKAIADRAEAQKASALKRLSALSVTPGTRADCMQLLREADEALNLVRSASE